MSPEPPGLVVGLDLVRVSEVADALSAYGERYVTRLFTEHESQSCPGDLATRAAGLAARLAAKEATLKALRVRDRPGAQGNVVPLWTDMEVVRHPDGWCSLSLSGDAAKLKEEAGVHDLTVSMSHEDGVAAAVVVGLRWPARQHPEPQA